MPVTTIKRCQSEPDWWYIIEDCNLECVPESGTGLTITYFTGYQTKKGRQLLAVNKEDALLIRDAINQLYPPTWASMCINQVTTADPVEAVLATYRELRDTSADLLLILDYYLPEDADRPTAWDPCRKRLRRLLTDAGIQNDEVGQ